MDTTLTANALMAEQDKRITETISRERGRLRNFIRQRADDAVKLQLPNGIEELVVVEVIYQSIEL